MNLIEQLGGYSAAKAHVLELVSDYGEGVTEKTKLYDFKFNVGQVKKALLEYRRQHNIFEIDDLYVFTEKYSKQSAIHKVDSLKSGKGCIRHATDEEIAAGRRL